MAAVRRPELIRMMVGRDLSTVFPKIEVQPGVVVLEVDGLTSRAAGIDSLSLSVRAGEILGLAGLVGAGRTELARVLFGITPADRGTVWLCDKPVSIRSPHDAVRHGIAYVPEDRRRHGVILDLPVSANMTLAVLRRVASLGWMDYRSERRLAADYVDRLGVRTASLDTPVGELSGGNQQKVALARWLATQPRVLILDEPTQGIDVGAKAEIHRLMSELAAQGLAIIMISSELPEVLGMSDRVAVMHDHRIVAMLDHADATPETVLALALGHPRTEPPRSISSSGIQA
jgi:rhamnose transport system ATP-binding protein